MTIKNFFFLFLVVMMISSCAKDKVDSAREILAQVKQKYVPDSRTGIFEISIRSDNKKFILKGETDNPEAKKALHAQLSDNLIIDHINVLPDSALGSLRFGIVNNSVGNLRSDPEHASELVSQALLGTVLKVLKKEREWFLVQTPDQYIAWIDSGAFVLKNKEGLSSWNENEKIIFTHPFGFIYSDHKKTKPVSDLVIGNIVEIKKRLNEHYEVVLPDGRSGFVPVNQAVLYNEWVNRNVDKEFLVEFSRQFLGVPYLWGGTSIKGVDCSGFTKNIYFMYGINLPRDASQQIQIGETIDHQRKFDLLQKGDLLFFGKPATDSTTEKVVHVGMWIGNMEYIHASGRVRINSMDPGQSNFDLYNYNRYLRTKRIITSSGDLHDKSMRISIN